MGPRGDLMVNGGPQRTGCASPAHRWHSGPYSQADRRTHCSRFVHTSRTRRSSRPTQGPLDGSWSTRHRRPSGCRPPVRPYRKESGRVPGKPHAGGPGASIPKERRVLQTARVGADQHPPARVPNVNRPSRTPTVIALGHLRVAALTGVPARTVGRTSSGTGSRRTRAAI